MPGRQPHAPSLCRSLLATLALLATPSCSLAFSRRPPPDHENQLEFRCSDTPAWPMLDGLGMLFFAGSGIEMGLMTAAEYRRTYADEDPAYRTAGVGFLLASGLVYAASATHGYFTTVACDGAKRAAAGRATAGLDLLVLNTAAADFQTVRLITTVFGSDPLGSAPPRAGPSRREETAAHAPRPGNIWWLVRILVGNRHGGVVQLDLNDLTILSDTRVPVASSFSYEGERVFYDRASLPPRSLVTGQSVQVTALVEGPRDLGKVGLRHRAGPIAIANLAAQQAQLER